MSSLFCCLPNSACVDARDENGELNPAHDGGVSVTTSSFEDPLMRFVDIKNSISCGELGIVIREGKRMTEKVPRI